MTTDKANTELSGRAKLINTAERLYGIHGLEGISLRQIIKAAGHANNYAVQYHFGSAEGLIRAILKKNTLILEGIREKMLVEAEANGRSSDPGTLVDIMYRPLADSVDSDGERTIARFSLAFSSHPGSVLLVGDMVEFMGPSMRTLDLLYAAIPYVPPALIRERLRLINIMVLSSIFNRIAPFEGDDMDEALLENVLAMATDSLKAAVPDQIRDRLR